ncbi:MAG TPA: hypothetical protein PL117_01935 [Accumulibacter sp.]|uniref:ARPP-1 family domain-containing protein n=1 Tax=Accumulibacter sp. TaxID=2053492 RepID=UPI002C70C61A|nr:DUF6569 family protein [Accumulibacter sp.]HRF71507.1 hypothetical protein [Accumulibacter sp.]
MNSIAQRLATLTIGQPARHRNLALFPLIGARAGLLEYMTLDEALTTGLIRIAEDGVAGRVSEVSVENDAAVPVLLIEGEELVGCRQNRVINVSILVPPKSELVVPVSCVEQGRWNPTSAAFESSGHAQFSKGRANKVTSVSASLAAGMGYHSDQAAVWAGIRDKAEALQMATATMAMADIYSHACSSLADFERCLSKSKGAVGGIFCIGESAIGIDLFDQPSSWTKYRPKLLKGYALDALDALRQPFDQTPISACAFFERLRIAQFDVRPSLGIGEDLRADQPDITAAALVSEDTVVHLCGFPQERDVNPTQSIHSRILRRQAHFGRTAASE